MVEILIFFIWFCRISRGDKGNLFILKMVDRSYRVPVWLIEESTFATIRITCKFSQSLEWYITPFFYQKKEEKKNCISVIWIMYICINNYQMCVVKLDLLPVCYITKEVKPNNFSVFFFFTYYPSTILKFLHSWYLIMIFDCSHSFWSCS